MAKRSKKTARQKASSTTRGKKARAQQAAPAGGASTRRARRSALVDTRVIWCGDCLDQVRKLPDGCVDLIYIDPPFNSNRNYEVFWGEAKETRRFEDRHASTRAYIDYMRPRCSELHRVLKKTGSFYYHCDWHASHYVKVMLDQIFGENQFQNEIVWQRTTNTGSSKARAKRFSADHDVVFFYVGSRVGYTFNMQFRPYSEAYIRHYYVHDDGDGRGPYQLQALKTVSKSRLADLEAAGRIVQGSGRYLRYKDYLADKQGVPVNSIWTDIEPVNPIGKEKLGYPTQKPIALLERIIKASSNPNDIVLDAFCGCGTALVAAENLGRQWIGIDISPTACRVMAKRLQDVCGLREDETLWKAGRGFVVRELPYTEKQLRAMPPFEFENWAINALGGEKNLAQVGDMGIDGRIFPVGARPESEAKDKKTKTGATGPGMFLDDWYPIQVKQKDKAGRPDIDAFEAVMVREERVKGFFVAFGYTSDALTEIDRFFRQTGKVIVALTVKQILEEQLAHRLA